MARSVAEIKSTHVELGGVLSIRIYRSVKGVRYWNRMAMLQIFNYSPK